MRYEITAHKDKDVVYKKFSSETEARIAEWELRMSGYKTKIIITGNRTTSVIQNM